MPPPPPSLPQTKQQYIRQDKTAEEKSRRSNEQYAIATEELRRSKRGDRTWFTMDTFEDLQVRIECMLGSAIHTRQILVSFDFDGTLCARRTSLSKNKPKNDAVTVFDTEQEEEKSRAMLTYLNTHKIPYIINTAADNPSHANQTMIQKKMPMSIYFEKMMGPDIQSIQYRNVKILRHGHVFSAGYDKHIPIDYVIQTYRLATRVVIHVDDGLINLKTVMEDHLEQNVVGAYFPTVEGTTIGNEPDTDIASDYLYNTENTVMAIDEDRCINRTHRDSNGTKYNPFSSKASADRFQKLTGKRFKKGDVVYYWFKRILYNKWSH